jgi:hypothetical protein
MCEDPCLSTSLPTLVTYLLFFVTTILVGVKCYHIVLLICISLMTNKIEGLSPLAICISSLEKTYPNLLPAVYLFSFLKLGCLGRNS